MSKMMLCTGERPEPPAIRMISRSLETSDRSNTGMNGVPTGRKIFRSIKFDELPAVGGDGGADR